MDVSDLKLCYWPTLTSGLLLFQLLLTYAISVLNGHVYYFFPYMSDTGAVPPESCIFGQLMNLQAVTLGTTLYIRYRQVDLDIDSGAIDLPKYWNTRAIQIAAMICLGISIVGNFQEVASLPVHFFGAFLVFGGGILYFYIQTRISFASTCKSETNNSNYLITTNVLYLRVLLASVLLPLFGLVGICGALAWIQFKGNVLYWWTREDGAFELRLVSTFSEWILTLSMYGYIMTFTKEFESLEFEKVIFIAPNRNVNGKLMEISNLNEEPHENNNIDNLPKIYSVSGELLENMNLNDSDKLRSMNGRLSHTLVGKEDFVTEINNSILEHKCESDT